MNIRHSMYWMISLLIIIPFLIFALLMTHIYSGRLENVLKESLQVVSAAQVADLTEFCEQQRNNLFVLSNMEVSQAAIRGELSTELLRYLDNILYARSQGMDCLDDLAIIDNQYNIIACSAGQSAFNDEDIKQIINGLAGRDFYITDVLNNRQGEKVVAAAAPIATDDWPPGYIVAEINLDFCESIRQQAKLWHESTFYLLDGKQQIISAGTPQEKREQFVTTEQERADYHQKYTAIDFSAHPTGSFQYRLGGREYVTYYSLINYTDWKVLLSVDLSNYHAQRLFYYLAAIFMVVLCIILALWISWFASRRIVRPIRDISDTLKAIQNGQDYSLRIAVQKEDELGFLAKKINELIDFIETENLYRSKQQRLLQEKADRDALTKVLNKERIQQYLAEALIKQQSRSEKLAVLFVDVDDFKAFNTQYGHATGDQVLLFVSAVLARESKGIVGRIGGDEFLVVVEDTAVLTALEQCLQQIAYQTAQRFTLRGSGEQLPITCCIGAVYVDFSLASEEAFTAERLIHLADEAMYQVKNCGKKGYHILRLPQGKKE